jgi:hypothetical protein
MTNYFYSEEFQDFPKSKKQQNTKQSQLSPSHFTMSFVLGYSAALSVIKSKSIGNLKILMN